MGRLTDDSTIKSASALSRQQYGYNPDSSLASKTVTQTGNTSAGTFGYTYDAGSRLTGVTGPGATAYGYDKSGNRLSANGSTFTYDQRNRLLGSTGAVKLTYSWTPRGTLVSAAGNGNNTTGYTFDGLDRLSGVGAVTYGYDSLDRVRSRAQSTVSSTFAYAGFESDPVNDGTTTYARSPGGRLLGQTKTGVF